MAKNHNKDLLGEIDNLPSDVNPKGFSQVIGSMFAVIMLVLLSGMLLIPYFIELWEW